MGTEVIGADLYGLRRVNWVRLLAHGTGGIVFFANTHGPLFQCSGHHGKEIGRNYSNAIERNAQPGDAILFTGDFNCGPNDTTILELLSTSTLVTVVADESYGGADHTFTQGVSSVSHAVNKGEPSDHQLVKAHLRLPRVFDITKSVICVVLGLVVAFGLLHVTVFRSWRRARKDKGSDETVGVRDDLIV